MRLMIRTASVMLLMLTLAASVPGRAQRQSKPVSPADTTAAIVKAAQALVAMLDDAGRSKVQFPADGPQKTR